MKVGRKLGDRLAQGDRIGGFLEVERRHADDEIDRRIFQIGQLIKKRCLEFDHRLALAIEFDAIIRDPAKSFLHVGHADLGVRSRRLAAPIELHRQQGTKFLVGDLCLKFSGKFDLGELVHRHGLCALDGLQQHDVASHGQNLRGSGGHGRLHLLGWSRQNPNNRCLIGRFARLGDDHFGARVRLD